MAMQAIGHGGQPLRDVFRPVDPPIPVLLDLTTLFPREPHHRGRYQPKGLQMYKVVTGTLACWGLCEQGTWWGLVSYPICFGPHTRTVRAGVPDGRPDGVSEPATERTCLGPTGFKDQIRCSILSHECDGLDLWSKHLPDTTN